MDNDGLTQYTRIAISLAERIASGQLKEGDKISGRSKLSPEYNVSPETIRRALRLLADMKVVEVKEQSGVYVLSADNARRYLRNFEEKTDMRSKQQQLKQLLARQELLNHQMAALCRDKPDAGQPAQLQLPRTGSLAGQRRHHRRAAVLAGHRRHHRGDPPEPVLYRLPRPLCRAVRRGHGDLCGGRQGP